MKTMGQYFTSRGKTNNAFVQLDILLIRLILEFSDIIECFYAYFGIVRPAIPSFINRSFICTIINLVKEDNVNCD